MLPKSTPFEPNSFRVDPAIGRGHPPQPRTPPAPGAAAASSGATQRDEHAAVPRRGPTRLQALADEAKALRQRGDSPDLDALWRKHLPDVPRTCAQTKARQFTRDVSAAASLLPLPQTLAPPHANCQSRFTAHNP